MHIEFAITDLYRALFETFAETITVLTGYPIKKALSFFIRKRFGQLCRDLSIERASYVFDIPYSTFQFTDRTVILIEVYSHIAF